MILNIANITWKGLSDWAKQERAEATEELVQSESHDYSNVLRGKISMLDEILLMPETIRTEQEIKNSQSDDEPIY